MSASAARLSRKSELATAIRYALNRWIQLTRYRDAILYVHDTTVKGMNEGKSVLTLMQEIKLPPALDIGESYGKLSWSVRGIYEGYVGWYDGNVSTMFGPPSQGYAEVVKLAGGLHEPARHVRDAPPAERRVRDEVAREHELRDAPHRRSSRTRCTSRILYPRAPTV